MIQERRNGKDQIKGRGNQEEDQSGSKGKGDKK